MKKIWITWEDQRRNYTLSKALSAQCYVININGNRWIRYIISIVRTFGIIIKEKPDVLFVQNPSMVLCLVSILYRKFKTIPLIVDAHNAGIRPFEGEKLWANRIAQYIMRNADITIVTNEKMADTVSRHSGKYYVLQDPIPDLACRRNDPVQLAGKYNIFFICTYSKDEPYLEVIKAAKLLDNSIYIYISGKPKRKEIEFGMGKINNVILTGFLPENSYLNMLHSCDVIMDLTSRQDCLVCGAYEAVAVEKPLIISDTEVNRKYFTKGVVYTKNESRDIAENIYYAISNIIYLKNEVLELKKDLLKDWIKRKNDFEIIVNSLYNSLRSRG